MQAPTWTVELIVAVASAVAAIIAAVYAWRSARIAGKALELAQHDHQERHADLKTYLIDGVTWDEDEGESMVAFACSISNTASAPFSIATIDLHLHAIAKDNTSTRVVLAPTTVDGPSIWELKPLIAPLNLDARATASGWIGFKLPKRVVDAMKVDKYEVVFQCSTGERSSVEQYLLKRIQNAVRQI